MPNDPLPTVSGQQDMDSFGAAALSPHLGMTKRQRAIAEEETSFIHANQMKEFTLKVVNPSKQGDVAGNVFQRASTPAIAVEKVKEKHLMLTQLKEVISKQFRNKYLI